MIALITSTLYPSKSSYSFFGEKERYEQTIKTLTSIHRNGFKGIYLLDNSIYKPDSTKIEADCGFKINTVYNNQYAFPNKGLNEALLILNNIHILPENEPIFKISGRYYPTEKFDLDVYKTLTEPDIIGIGSYFNKKKSFFSTRAYFVKDKRKLEEILVLAIEEMISYSKGIHGIKTLFEAFFANSLGTKFQLSLEQAYARILKRKKNFKLVDKINIEGYIAGSNYIDLISE